jgi:8-oxo-dGTP diphosphatase
MSESYIQDIRSKVGRQQIFIAYASVILRDLSGRILLQHRTDFDVWGLPGGVLELGEDILTCGRRELLEESGLTAGPLSLAGVYSDPDWAFTYPNGDQVQQFTVCLQGKINGGEMQVDGIETSRQAFFEPKDIPFDEIPPWYQAMLSDALQGKQPGFTPPLARDHLLPQIEQMRHWIGRQPLIGVGATAVTLREDGRVLMMRRREEGFWTFPAGYAHLGENAAHTAVRETHEETGYRTEPVRLLGVYSPRQAYVYPNGDQTQSVIAVFCMRLTGGTLQETGEETSGVAWKTADEIRRLDVHPLVRPLHLAVLDHLETGSFLLT